MAPWTAAPIALLLLLVGDFCNRRVIGFLPDDPPDEARKQHGRPMSLQGILLLPLLVGPLLYDESWTLAGAVALAMLVGFLDDRRKERRRGLGVRWKALGLGLSAVLVALAAGPWQLDQPGLLVLTGILAFGLINATNFLDNTDGVACSLSIVSLLVLTGGEGPLAPAAFAALGFLPWNWPRPRAFLGDAGAYGLGACVAAAAVVRLQRPEVALLPVAVQLVDLVQVVAARLWLGLPPWIGDRRHLTHLLHVNLGLGRTWVAPVLCLVALVTATAPWWWPA